MRATSDPFGKVRALIEGMIATLMKQASEEASAKSFCDEELSKSKAKQGKITGTLDKTTSRLEKAEAAKAETIEMKKETMAAIADDDAEQAEATEVRHEGHEDYVKESTEYKGNIEAVAGAVEKLEEYYGSSFVQLKAETRRLRGTSTNVDAGKGVLNLLENNEERFTTILSDVESVETEEEKTYEKTSEELGELKLTLKGEVKTEDGEMKHLESLLLDLKQDKASTGKELDAVLEYLDKLKPQCETKVMDYAQRKAAREAEIEGLKQAMEVLSAEA